MSGWEKHLKSERVGEEREKAIVCRVNNPNILLNMVFKAGSFSDSIFRIEVVILAKLRQEILKC